MTLSDLRTAINDSRRDITSNFVTNAEITRYLNKGLRLLQTRNDFEFTQTSANFTYTNGSNTYALSATTANNDFKQPINIFYDYTHSFTFCSPEDFDVLKNYNYDLFAIDGDYLLVNSSVGTSTLTHNYYSTYTAKTSGNSWIAELTNDTDKPLLPDNYQDILVDYSLQEIFKKEGKYDDYKIVKNEFEEKFLQLQRIYKGRAAKIQTRMRNPREYHEAVFDPKQFV